MLRSFNFLRVISSNTTSKLFSVLISFIVFSILTACNPQNDSIAPQAETSARAIADVGVTNQVVSTLLDSNSTLKSVSTFPIGAAFNSRVITTNTKAYQLFLSQFNSKTVHAYMNVEPVQGQFNFAEPDFWVNMAQANPMRLHGHCLIYHMGNPEWTTKFSGNIPGFEQAIKNHIQTVVSRYRGKIKSWDVINEIFEYNSGKIRQTAFRQIYPNDAAYMTFVKRCFEWAHTADPDAILFYNDFSLEAYPAKVQAVLNLVNDFKRSGTPIHGIGTQMHVDLNVNDGGISNSLRQLSGTGLQIHISELDVALNSKNDQNIIFSQQLLNAQSAKYKTIALAYKQMVPTTQQYGITMWSLTDADSWLVNDKKQLDQPNVFDKKFNKKPAFYGLMEGLKG